MWIMTKLGFFSIVEKPEDRKNGNLTVRARVRADLENLRKQFLPGLGPIQEDAGTDYRYRAKAKKADGGAALAGLTESVDYANFKNEVAKRQGKLRAEAYGKVWSGLYQLQDNPPTPSASKSVKALPAPLKSPNGKAMAYGGVLVDGSLRVLLRRPTGDYDGYVWTFPKGRPDPGESAAQAALREVEQETGYKAKITGKLPSGFEGGTTMTEFFVMAPRGEPGSFDNETADIKWVTLSEAEKLIAMTRNSSGRKRDLAVLMAIREYFSVTP